jgi:hypothetical protein
VHPNDITSKLTGHLPDALCQNHSADDAVLAHTKGPCLRGRTVDCLHTLKRKVERGGETVNTSRESANRYIRLMGQVMSMDSPMLSSIYSQVKKLLRKL